MLLSKEILQALGWEFDTLAKVFYLKDDPDTYMYWADIKNVSLKEFVDKEKEASYKDGYSKAQQNIRKALGLE